jgi:hypothetical protein
MLCLSKSYTVTKGNIINIASISHLKNLSMLLQLAIFPEFIDAVYEKIATPAKFGLVVGAGAGVAGAEACIVYGIPT